MGNDVSLIDRFFETEKLICVKKQPGTRTYIDQGCREDYGSFWAAIFAMKHSKKISENLEECFWYNGDKKENLITDFSDIRKIRITDAKSGEGLRE